MRKRYKIDRTLIATHQWQTHDVDTKIQGMKYNSKKNRMRLPRKT